ncbi:hypothetical protein V5799_013602 [Amblyomma americanum]|uniref:Uncharacterized protein n=1 Tax=Amblyomma americanum TaxID=6943 RepID=A0AAQ4E5F1_AMBAM
MSDTPGAKVTFFFLSGSDATSKGQFSHIEAPNEATNDAFYFLAWGCSCRHSAISDPKKATGGGVVSSSTERDENPQ